VSHDQFAFLEQLSGIDNASAKAATANTQQPTTNAFTATTSSAATQTETVSTNATNQQ
jgi:hypothetical protein